MSISKIKPGHLLGLFVIFQVFVISLFLLNKADEIVSFNLYLQGVKYSTILFLLISLLYLYKNYTSIFNYNLLSIVFLLQIIILYFSMLIHTDIKAITSPTIFLMLTLFIIFSIFNLNLKTINIIVLTLISFNFIFILMQTIDFFPVAQLNQRENLGFIDNRPTGIFFNAFAMGYASIILFLICLYFLVKRNLTNLNLFGLILSFISVILSATRTPLLLLIILSLLIVFQNNNFVIKNGSLISISLGIFVILIPIISVIYGNLKNNESFATLNGRLFIWQCVVGKWQEFIPFGVGVQGAFPRGFCSDDIWFSNLRHPENMFLLNFVESGILGIVGLIALFFVAFWKSANSLKNANALPLALTAAYFMCSLFYVPLFHYIPFLENRPADRGIFNFFVITIIWLVILTRFEPEKVSRKSNKKQLK